MISEIRNLVSLGAEEGKTSPLSAAAFLPQIEQVEVYQNILSREKIVLFSFVASRLSRLSPDHAQTLREALHYTIERIIARHTLALEDVPVLISVGPFLEPELQQSFYAELHDIVAYEIRRNRLYGKRRQYVFCFPEPYRRQLHELLLAVPLPTPTGKAYFNTLTGRLNERHRLYQRTPLNFRALPLQKDGSELTIFGGILEDRTITCTIDPLAFLGWRKAFEASDTWQNLGFSYVPVEPIIRTSSGKQAGKMNVYARVLKGITVEKWFENSNILFEKEIRTRQANIREGLLMIGAEFAQVNRGHDHDNNYIVVPERDENGKRRLDVPPRVYLIDFDQAAPFVEHPTPEHTGNATQWQ